VVVGNIGTVHTGRNKNEATKTFNAYKKISKAGHGRAGGEMVALFCDGEEIGMYWGSLGD
jgi:hypothetical protein